MNELLTKYTNQKHKIQKDLEGMRRKGHQDYTSYKVLEMLLAQIEEFISDISDII